MARSRNDPAHVATDEILRRLEKRIEQEFKQAHEEVTNTLNDYLARFAKKDAKWREWVKQGKRTKEAYSDWRKQQMIVGNRWAALRDQMASTYTDATAAAQRIVRGEMPEVYALNYNYATYDVERQAARDTQFTLYSRETVKELLSEDPDLYHAPGKKTQGDINRGVVKAWDKQRIQSVMMQGILQGESIPKLSERLKRVTNGEKAAAIRNARTMSTGVQNKGREDAYARAESLGIEMEEMWLAIHDLRTRHWHRQLDYVTKKVGGYWENEIGKIRYPGDPQADGANIYNCRCTTRAVVKGLKRQAYKLASDEGLKGMTYEEWKASRKSKSNPLTLPEEKGEAIRQSYLRMYGGGGKKKGV